MKTTWLLPLLLAACDASGETFTITVQTDVPPRLLALRDGPSAPWQAVPLSGGTYGLAVHGPYAVALVCDFPTTDAPGLIDIEQYQRTPDDERTIASTCALPKAPGGHVIGHMVQAGEVALDFGVSEVSSGPDWDFNIAVVEGGHQLVAIADDRIVRRDLAVVGTAQVGTIDVATDGAAFVPAPLRVTNATASESVRASTTLLTRDQTFARIYGGDPAGALAVPASVLGAGDHQRVRVTASDGSSAREVFRPELTSDDVVLPEPLGPVQFTVADNTLTATWSTLPAHDDGLTAELDSASGALQQFIFYFVSVSNAYADATGATSVTFETDLPGFVADWVPDLAADYNREVSVAVRTPTETRTSRESEAVPATGGNAVRGVAAPGARVSSGHAEYDDETAPAGRLRLRVRNAAARREL